MPCLTLRSYEGTGNDDSSEEEEEGEDAVLDMSSVIFLVDSGTEGFRGNIRVITPGILSFVCFVPSSKRQGMSSCIDCNVEMFPPEVKIPLCTIAATPRNAAHCIM